jgi:hypothetical protein
MKLVRDPEAAAWLEGLAGETEDFDWDAGNRTKNRKHGVEVEDVEALLGSPILFAGRVVEPTHVELLAAARPRRESAPARPHLHPSRSAIAADQLPANEKERKGAL